MTLAVQAAVSLGLLLVVGVGLFWLLTGFWFLILQVLELGEVLFGPQFNYIGPTLLTGSYAVLCGAIVLLEMILAIRITVAGRYANN